MTLGKLMEIAERRLTTQVKRMTLRRRENLTKRFNAWFEYDDPMPDVADVKAVVVNIMNADPILVEGGLMSFLQKERVVRAADLKMID